MKKQYFVRKNVALIEAQQRQEKKRARRTALYIAIFVAVALIFIGVCFAVFLRIKTVNVTGSEHCPAESILELFPAAVGDNIYSFTASEAEDAIVRALPYIASVKVTRKLPTVVNIEIKEEQAVFATPLAGDVYLIAADLKVLERVSADSEKCEGLITLSLNSIRRCVVGEILEFVDKRTFDAVSGLYADLSDNYIEKKITSLDVRSRFDISFRYEDRFDVYFGDMDNSDIKVRFLVEIIDQLYPDSRGRIDVSDATEASVKLY